MVDPWPSTHMIPTPSSSPRCSAPRGSFNRSIRARLIAAGFEDLPRNGPFVLGGMANHGIAAGDLVKDLGVSKQAASQLIDTLVVRGYLDRTVNEDDRRRMTIVLTERGREAAKVVRAGVAAVDRELVSRISPEGVAAFRAGLVALCEIKDGAARDQGSLRPGRSGTPGAPAIPGGANGAGIDATHDVSSVAVGMGVERVGDAGGAVVHEDDPVAAGRIDDEGRLRQALGDARANEVGAIGSREPEVISAGTSPCGGTRCPPAPGRHPRHRIRPTATRSGATTSGRDPPSRPGRCRHRPAIVGADGDVEHSLAGSSRGSGEGGVCTFAASMSRIACSRRPLRTRRPGSAGWCSCRTSPGKRPPRTRAAHGDRWDSPGGRHHMGGRSERGRAASTFRRTSPFADVHVGSASHAASTRVMAASAPDTSAAGPNGDARTELSRASASTPAGSWRYDLLRKAPAIADAADDPFRDSRALRRATTSAAFSTVSYPSRSTPPLTEPGSARARRGKLVGDAVLPGMGGIGGGEPGQSRRGVLRPVRARSRTTRVPVRP